MNQLAHDLAANYEFVSLEDFADRAKAAACPDLDTSFMAYFLELANEKNDGQFVVPHQKLVEYGVATSGQGGDMKKRLERLGLVEGQEYQLRHVSELRIQGGTAPKNQFRLTPEAFKSCLMRAQRRANQPIDPVKYSKYYLFLEKVVKYFGVYERARLAHQNKVLGDKNSNLEKNIEFIKTTNAELIASNNELKVLNLDQTMKIDKLLEYADDSKQQIADLHDKLDAMFTFTTEFARMTLPMWVGSSVFRTQLDQLSASHSLPQALRRLKVMFAVGFFRDNRLTIYFCCTNFADVGKRIKLLAARHAESRMFRPAAICLISHEVNYELAKLSQMNAFPEDTIVDFDKKTKSFVLSVSPNKSEEIFGSVVANARLEKFQGYQLRRDSSAKDIALSPKIMQHLAGVDKAFFQQTLPLCQEYIDAHVKESGSGYEYARPSQKQLLRDDLQRQRYTDVAYALMLLHRTLDTDSGRGEIDRMVKSGVITKEDARDLIRVGKSVAQAEDVKLSKEMLDKADEVERACAEEEP